VAGLLSRDDLARFVGDARIFAHSYKEGGTSIITGYLDRVRFVEAFYQVVVPYLDEREWKLVAKEIGPIGPKLLRELSSTLATHRLRLAAASGQFDKALLAMLDAAGEADVDVFDVLHAMREPAHLATHAPRLDYRLLGVLALEKWIDRFGATQAAWIVASINSATTKKDAAPLVATLVRLLPPDALAPIMQQIARCKAKPDVDKWLARHAQATKVAKNASSAKTDTPKATTRTKRRGR